MLHGTAQHSASDRREGHSGAQHTFAVHPCRRTVASCLMCMAALQLPCCGVLCCKLLCSSAAQCSTPQYSTAQHLTAQLSISWGSTAQHCIASYSTAQHLPAQQAPALHAAPGYIPGPCVGLDHGTEDLLAGPQLYRLQDARHWQIILLCCVTHIATQQAEVASGVEAVLAGQQEC